MARSAATTVENNFSKGLITEATGLNFPENACTETFDCVFDEKGKVLRRLGLNYETDYTLNGVDTSNTDKAIARHVWENVAGQGDITFVVIQFGNTVNIFQTGSTDALSDALLFTVDISDYQVAGAPDPASKACSFTSGNGALFISHPYCEPFYVEYDLDMGSISSTQIHVKIRDFAGVDDTLDVDARPTTLSALHKYNLYNQGWYATAEPGTGGFDSNNGGGDVNVLSYWDTKRSDYPSNADIWWTMKNAYNLFVPQSASRFAFVGNTHAPQGHYLLNPFYEDRTDASGVPGLSVVSSGYQRPSVCAFHSSRLFMAGVQAAEYSNKIYMSQIIKSPDQYGKCYQSNDPTSEDISDLLPTDGGVLAVMEAGQIIHLVSVESFLVVFATNGIWGITGSQGTAIAANDYAISKISDIPTSSAQSFVIVNGFPVWWTNDGIYALVFDKITGSMQVKSLTDQSIKTFFDDIPVSSKSYASGAYNPRTKVVQWTYRSTAGTSIAEYHQHDRVLCLNTLSEAFYPWRVTQLSETDGPWISGIICTKGQGVSRQSTVVTDHNGVTVTDSIGNAVTVNATTTQYLTSSFRYVTIVKSGGLYNLTFTQEADDDYVDWGSESYESYLMSGYKVHGQGIVKFQTNYLNVFMAVEGDASCYLQSWWDYSDNTSSGRVMQSQQCYRDDTNFTYTRRRLKIRGNGIALQFKLFSEEGKPFTIIGWAGFESGNTLP